MIHEDMQKLLLLDRAVQDTDDSVLITDADIEPPGPRIVFVNPGFTRMTGYAAHEVLGRSPRMLQGPLTDRAVLDRLRRCLVAGTPFFGETINYRKDGTPYHLEWHISPVREADGRISHFVSVQRDVSDRKRAEEAAQELRAQKARAAAILETQEEERRRIAKELHDGIGQMLAAVKLNLEILEDAVAPTSDAHREHFQGIKTMLADVVAETRRIAHNLMPSALDDFGLIPALTTLCERISGQSPLRVHFYQHGADRRLESHVEVGLYRIVQEALTNVIKHAEATDVNIQVIKNPWKLVLTVDDNGRGFSPSGHPTRGIGLLSMKERAESLHGTFTLDSQPGEGTSILVDIPMERP